MTKKSKKRSKKFKNQSTAKPVITKISAEDRGPIKQWWLDKKRLIKPIAIMSLIVIVLVIIIFEIFRLIFN